MNQRMYTFRMKMVLGACPCRTTPRKKKNNNPRLVSCKTLSTGRGNRSFFSESAPPYLSRVHSSSLRQTHLTLLCVCSVQLDSQTESTSREKEKDKKKEKRERGRAFSHCPINLEIYFGVGCMCVGVVALNSPDSGAVLCALGKRTVNQGSGMLQPC